MSRPLDHLKHVPFQAPAVTPLSREQGRYSSKEQEQTEVGELQEQENPRETAHTNNPSKEQEQTEEGKMQELEEHDKDQGPDSPEEQAGPVKHPMRKKAGWLRRKWRRWRSIETPSKNTSSADNVNFSPPAGSQENAESSHPETSPRLPHARGT